MPPTKQTIQVLIIDDQVLFATSLKLVLEHLSEGEIQIVGIGYNGGDCLDLLKRTKPDVILMDMKMPVLDGLEASRLVREKYPEVRLIVLTTFADEYEAQAALAVGVNGYLLKNIAPEELVVFIRAVQEGAVVMSPLIGSSLMTPDASVAGTPAPPTEDSDSKRKMNYIRARFPALKDREIQVLYQVILGRTNSQISMNLHIAEQTVRNYTSAIYAKIGADDRLHSIQILNSF